MLRYKLASVAVVGCYGGGWVEVCRGIWCVLDSGDWAVWKLI